MQLLGEEVNTEEAVLAGGWGGGDLDDLAGTSLEDHDVANADVVGWDSDGVGDAATLALACLVTGSLAAATAGGRGDLYINLGVVVVVATVHNAVGGTVKTVAERVVVTLTES